MMQSRTEKGIVTEVETEADSASRVRHPKRLSLALAMIAHRLSLLLLFRSLRVLHDERLAEVCEDAPLIVIANHPSWWDPVPLLHLQMLSLPRRVAYFPTESNALQQAKHLTKLGSFPLSSGSVSGTRRFMQDCKYIFSSPDAVLWVTPEGLFSDPRKRPLELRRGLASLISRSNKVTVIPLAIEYTLWESKELEVLTSWGEPIRIEDGTQRTTNEWHAVLTTSLTRTMDELAEISIKREHWKFRVVVYGRLGWHNLRKLVADIRMLYRHRRPD